MSQRTEQDSLGELQVPAAALYAAQTQRAINNFPISGLAMPTAFIRALLQMKAVAAQTNGELNQIPTAISVAIIQAADALFVDENVMQHFPVDVFQTGSGTSTNMNANEVIANQASVIAGVTVNPNDHVNFGQSSNDVIPSCIHISAAIVLEKQTLPALRHLLSVIKTKAAKVGGHVKTGRTHLMDAMPIRMDQALSGWAQQIEDNIQMLQSQQPMLQALAQGGTAVGTGINTPPEFAARFCHGISTKTGIPFSPAENYFSRISSQDVAVSLSGQLKTVAVSIMKIANDLRWMNSGPLAGLSEIELEALQPGSSIMPGKVNPVIPEAATMVAAQVIGNDTTITIAGQSGNFELNVMLPVIAHNLLQSLELIANTSRLLADKAIATFTMNQTKIDDALARNPILVTALNPIIGYAKAAEIAKQAYKQKRPVIDVATELTDLSRGELIELLDPAKLTEGGVGQEPA